jgi:hypothetical protein
MSTAMEDSSNWGSVSFLPISWGKADPPPHPDEGLEWSQTSDRADRVAWDLRQAASGSPPPKSLAKDLFSNRGDGFPIGHLRRKGESAESMAIDQEYISSGSRNGERDSTMKGKEESSSNGDQELPDDEQGLSSYGEREGNAAGPRPLRESRKTPFSLSPPPNPRSKFSFPRQYKFDESYVELDVDFDTILERQRIADQNSPTEDKPVPKRKREVLSDQDHRLRKERTDDLVEGLRNVRENVKSEGLRNARLQREVEKKGELSDSTRLRDDYEVRRENDVLMDNARRVMVQQRIDMMNRSPICDGLSPHELVYGTSTAPPAVSEQVGGKEERDDGGNEVLRQEIAELVEENSRG